MPPNEGQSDNQPHRWIVKESNGDPALLHMLKNREDLYDSATGSAIDRSDTKDIQMRVLHRLINNRKAELGIGVEDKT